MGRKVLSVKRCRRCGCLLPSEKFPTTPLGRIGGTCYDCRKAEIEDQKAKRRERDQTAEHAAGNAQLKKCPACGQSKPLTAFLPGFSHCRECQRNRRERG